jgi:hypothetical protein
MLYEDLLDELRAIEVLRDALNEQMRSFRLVNFVFLGGHVVLKSNSVSNFQKIRDDRRSMVNQTEWDGPPQISRSCRVRGQVGVILPGDTTIRYPKFAAQGQIVSTANRSRLIQFSLKLQF